MGRMVDTLPTVTSPQEGGRVAVVCDMVTVVADLSVPELFGKVQADVMGTVQVQDGLGLIGGRGNQDFVTHWVCLNFSHYRHGVRRFGGAWWTVCQPSHLTLDPLPLGDLLSGRHLAAHVMTALHCDGELLVLHVGTDVVHLGDLTREGGPGATDVEVSGFVHESMMAHPGESRSSR